MKIFNIIVFTGIVFTTIFAGGGSVYSRYGLGDVYLNTSARTLGMGELNIAQADNNYFNSLNPAGWHNVKFTRFETGDGF